MADNTVTENKRVALSDVVNIIYVTAQNAAFETRDGFLALKIKLPPDILPEEVKPDENKDKDIDKEKDKNGKDKNDKEKENKDKQEKPEEKKPEIVVGPDGLCDRDFPRVFLHRAFPFENPFEYISVLNPDNKEIGLIRKLDELRQGDRQLIIDELERKYYTPTISKISSMKERFGFSYWTVTTDAGERTFTMQDTYRSIHKIDINHIFLTDVDGNRYDIPDVEALDHKSYKKIELYL